MPQKTRQPNPAQLRKQQELIANGHRDAANMFAAQVPRTWDAKTAIEVLQGLGAAAGCCSQLMALAKMQWRLNLADPRPVLRETLEVAREAAKGAKGLSQQDLARQPVSFPSLAFVGLLIEGEVPKQFEPYFPKVKEIDGPFNDRVPLTMLLKAMQTGRKPPGWDAVMAELEGLRNKQYADSFRGYMDLVLSAARGDMVEAEALARQAEAEYFARAKDHRQFSTDEGGGPFNDTSVDHRLSAILRHAFREHPDILKRLNSIHRWLWD